MSRHTIHTTKEDIQYEVVYGFDHPLQEYFLQVYRPDKIDDYDFDPTGEGLMLNEGSRMTHKSNGQMLELYQEWGVPTEIQELVALDLIF